MHLPSGLSDDEVALVKRCQQGEASALESLRGACHAALANILLARGATQTETDDLLADLWADCVPGADDRPSLLDKFSGRCTPQAWLATVATRRWIDLKRKQARRGEAGFAGEEGQDAVEQLAAAVAPDKEDGLVELLRESLEAAFSVCSAEAMVLLRLRYLHGVSQRELVRMLGWHESKVSRALSAAMREIEVRTLEAVKRRDPWLELTWGDFLDLCETQQLGFL